MHASAGTPGAMLQATRIPVVIEDVTTDGRFSGSPVLQAAAARSCVAVLVYWGSTSLATLVVLDPRGRDGVPQQALHPRGADAQGVRDAGSSLVTAQLRDQHRGSGGVEHA